MIILWDIDAKTKKVIIDSKNIFTNIYNEENFLKDLKSFMEEEKIKSQFSLSELDSSKIIEFLKTT